MLAWDSISGCITESGVATLRCLPAVMNNIIIFALMASGVVALFFVILAGAKLVTSSGEQKKIDAAKKTLTWAIIGLVIILLSFFIVSFVSTIAGTQECVNSEIGFGKEKCGVDPESIVDPESTPE